MFRINHTGIDTDIIYHIRCNGKEYIGQSKQGFNRIQTHINNAFRTEHIAHTEYQDETGAERIYEEMRFSGLKNTSIIIYSSANNYGLDPAAITGGLSTFIPANETAETWSADQATPDQRRDAAEILHILSAFYNGKYHNVNDSFGGQSTSGRMKLKEDNVIKLLTRQTSVPDAARLINASSVSLTNLFNIFNQTKDLLFTDKGTSVYDSSITVNNVDNKLLPLTGSDFVEQYLVKMIVTGFRSSNNKLVYIGKKEDTETIRRFFETKITYLKAVTPLIGDKRGELTIAHKKLLNSNAAHLFTAHISIDSTMKYVTEALQRGLDNIVHNGKTGSGNIGLSKKTFSPISVTSLFDISSMQTKGNDFATIIQSYQPGVGVEISSTLKKQFALSNFQYIYNAVDKINFNPNAFYAYATEDLEVIKHVSLEKDGYPAVSMTSKYISDKERLNYRVHEKMHANKIYFVDEDGAQYFAEMMHLYRKYNNLLQQLYQYEDNHGNTLYATQPELENIPGIYYSDVYHQEMMIDLNNLTIY